MKHWNTETLPFFSMYAHCQDTKHGSAMAGFHIKIICSNRHVWCLNPHPWFIEKHVWSVLWPNNVKYMFLVGQIPVFAALILIRRSTPMFWLLQTPQFEILNHMTLTYCSLLGQCPCFPRKNCFIPRLASADAGNMVLGATARPASCGTSSCRRFVAAARTSWAMLGRGRVAGMLLFFLGVWYPMVPPKSMKIQWSIMSIIIFSLEIVGWGWDLIFRHAFGHIWGPSMTIWLFFFISSKD